MGGRDRRLIHSTHAGRASAERFAGVAFFHRWTQCHTTLCPLGSWFSPWFPCFSCNQQPTVEQNKGVKESLLKARQKALDIEKVFQERERARKNKYIIKLTSIATVVSIFAAGLAIILPLTEINLKDISWVVSFFLGALVSLVVSWILRRRDINRIHKEMTRMSEMRDILSTQIRKKGEEHRYEQ